MANAIRIFQALADDNRLRERALVVRALDRADWQLTQAASLLNVPVSSLQRLISRLDLRKDYAAHKAARVKARKESRR